MYKAHVNPRYFAAAQVFAGVKDIRFYLNSVCLQRHPLKGVILVGTDGYTMIVCHDPDGWMAPDVPQMLVSPLSPAMLALCKRSNGGKLSFGKYATDAKRLWLTDDHAVISWVSADADNLGPESPWGLDSLGAEKISYVDGTYPDFYRVVPAERVPNTEAFPAIQPKYLARINIVGNILTGKHGCMGVSMESTGHNKSLVARFADGEHAERIIFLLMPVRCDPQKNIVPDWYLLAKEAKEARLAAEIAEAAAATGKSDSVIPITAGKKS